MLLCCAQSRRLLRYAALEQLNSRRAELAAEREQLQGRLQQAQQVMLWRIAAHALVPLAGRQVLALHRPSYEL